MGIVYVAADGARLQRLVDLAAEGAIGVAVAAAYLLEAAAAALDHARRGASGGGVVLTL